MHYARMLVKPVPVVTNLSTSRMVDDIAAAFGQEGLSHAGGRSQCGGQDAGSRRPSAAAPSEPRPSEATLRPPRGIRDAPVRKRPHPSPPTLGSVIGGEGNGGIIDLRVGPVRDSFLGIAMILDLMTRTKKSISQLTHEFPAYAMIKTNSTAPRQSAALVAKSNKLRQRKNRHPGRRPIDSGWLGPRPQSNTNHRPHHRRSHRRTHARPLIAKIEALK